MDRNGFLIVIFLFLVVSDCSSAHSIWNLRKLIDVAPPKDNSPATTVLPLPSPNSNVTESKASPVDGGKSGGNKPKDHPDSLDHSTKVNNPKDSKNTTNQNTTNPKDSKKSDDQNTTNPKDSKKSDDQNTANLKDSKKSDDQNTTTSANPNPTKKQIGNEKNPEGKGKTDAKTDLPKNGSCEGSTKRCSDKKTLIACIQGLDSGSKDLVLLIQNEGESTLKVNITISTSLKKLMNESIPEHETKGINVSETIGQSTQIVVNAGNGECKLDMGARLSIADFLQRLPPYYKQVTPIYGAYLLFLIALIVGGTWACCKFRKRRRHDGVPYQELEMGLPESASAVNLEAAEGWDEGWDDDWDEDNAVKSPGGRRVGSISASGLTARSTNKDGWEKDWDD